MAEANSEEADEWQEALYNATAVTWTQLKPEEHLIAVVQYRPLLPPVVRFRSDRVCACAVVRVRVRVRPGLNSNKFVVYTLVGEVLIFVAGQENNADELGRTWAIMRVVCVCVHVSCACGSSRDNDAQQCRMCCRRL